MERKSKNGGFKMKGHTLPGISQMKAPGTADGRAKSSAFQAEKDEPVGIPMDKLFPGLVDFEVDVKGKETTRDRLAKKAASTRSGTVKKGKEQAARSANYKEADKALAKKGDKAAKQRLRNRAINIKKVKKAREKNPDITQAEINKIMSGN